MLKKTYQLQVEILLTKPYKCRLFKFYVATKLPNVYYTLKCILPVVASLCHITALMR